MRDTDLCTEQRQLGLRQFPVTDAKFHDDDEERSGADQGECDCAIRNRFAMRAPSNARAHSSLIGTSRPACARIRVWADKRGKAIIMYTERISRCSATES